MFTNNIRIFIIVCLVLLAGYELYNGHRLLAATFGILAAVVAWGYFRYGTVWTAFRSMKAGNNARARQLLNQIRAPKLLSSQQRAYYEWVLGVIEAEKGRFPLAESHFRTALENKIRTSNDRAIVESSLAEVLIELVRYPEASFNLDSVSTRDHKPGLDGSIAELRARIEQESRGNPKLHKTVNDTPA